MNRRTSNPFLTIVVSFAVFVFAGTLALYFGPSTTGPRLGTVDALFMATSACCVTGLTVIGDLSKDFTMYGQVMILILLQVGGLGIMLLNTLVILMVAGQISIRNIQVVKESLNAFDMTGVLKLAKMVFVLTILIEAAGTIAIYAVLKTRMGDVAGGRILFTAVFHAISAFCNAGFSLYGNSLERFSSSVSINMVMMSLILLGGIGFTVLIDVMDWTWALVFRRRRQGRRLGPHSMVVIISSIILVLLGAAVLGISERGTVLDDVSTGRSLMIVLFQSVTARTAGFNTVPIKNFSSAGLMILCLLMFIGASPGSTGGGIKTSTFTVLFMHVAAMWKGHDRVSVFRKTISRRTVNRCVALLLMALVTVFVTGVLLLEFERGNPALAGGHDAQYLLFEAFSAYGTVGLSCGVTSSLGSASKIVLILAMFIGKIGPLTLLAAFGTRFIAADLKYPETDLIVG